MIIPIRKYPAMLPVFISISTYTIFFILAKSDNWSTGFNFFLVNIVTEILSRVWDNRNKKFDKNFRLLKVYIFHVI